MLFCIQHSPKQWTKEKKEREREGEREREQTKEQNKTETQKQGHVRTNDTSPVTLHQVETDVTNIIPESCLRVLLTMQLITNTAKPKKVDN